MADVDLIIDRWPEGLAAIRGAVDALVEQGHLSRDVGETCVLAYEELVANAFDHGAGDQVRLRLRCEADELTAELVDRGPEFNLLDQPEPDVDAGIEEREVGGLGIFLVQQLMDRVDYRRIAGHNHVYVTKRLDRDGSGTPPDEPTQRG